MLVNSLKSNIANQFPLLHKYPEVFVAMSSRADGSMKILPESDKLAAANNKNRRKFLNRVGLAEDRVFAANLAHSNKITTISAAADQRIIDKVDGLITNIPNIYLSVTVADCLPIIIYHPPTHIVCLLHAGWRGLHSNIIQEAVDLLVQQGTISTHELVISIGPAIGGCHFVVEEDTLTKFQNFPTAINKLGSKHSLNLSEVARQQFLAAGVEDELLGISSICTYCSAAAYFSHRFDQLNPVAAMLVVVGVRS